MAASVPSRKLSTASNSTILSQELAPIVPGATNTAIATSVDVIYPVATARSATEDEIFRALSRRKSNKEDAPKSAEEHAEIERLLGTIFGDHRKQGEDEQNRHVGVVFKNLTVKGIGLGASLQPTNSDILMGLVRGFVGLVNGQAWRKQKPVRTLIHGFTGCVRPQEMLLVLGRPGSGCSTFLKVVGNQRGGYEEVTGDVTYGGVDANTMAKKYHGDVLYNPEDDLHYATLSVRETLRFALKTRTPGKASRGEGESRENYVGEFLRVISKLFWIEHTLETKVGGELVRGVSGGEKKRVSIAEAMVTKASTQCWDNSTKGLDASTAVEYVTSIRTLTNMDKISTLVALYQAGEQLYELFDKVILIDQGRCMYFGPTESAKTYFEHLGFYCPPRWTSADFLTSVTDPHERHVKPGWEDRIPRTAEEFENAFRNSDIAHANLRDIEAFENTLKHDSGTPIATKSTKTQNYKISFPRQVAACTSRQFKVMMGDPAVLYGKWVGLTFQSLIVGSLFYNLPQNAAGVFPRGGLLFFTLLFNALLAMAELSAAFSSRPILMKHKSFSFYRPSAHAIAQVALDIPFCLIQVSIWAIIIYFMADLQRTASQFFIFVFVSYTLSLSMNSFFRMLGAFTTSLDVATRMTGVAIQALVVYTGYLIPPSSMHPWFSWLRWINPVQYAFEALMANEFHNLNIKCVPPYLVPAGGPGVTPKHQSCLISGSSPGTTDVNGANYIWTQYRYTRVHLWRNVGIVIAFWAFFVVLNAIGLELLQPNIGGASVTVFKRGQTPEHVKQAMNKKLPTLVDEEVVEKDVAPLETSSPNRDVRTQVVKNDTVFTWQDVTYTINTKAGPRVLLNNIQGYVKPGRLTALMGESGAGKTTLLNTLAQRITLGTVQGTFLVDGKPLPLSFQRGTGFAEQQDVHEATMTVREALRFSALLRRPNTVPVQEKCDYVEQIIELLEMGNIAGATIGIPGSGLNQEQRKLVTIGVELASKPELLMFFDEPTSGLDSAAAFHIVRFLRTLADLGQIVLCTIHQPSAVLFEYFDELILLKRGGSMVYHGSLGPDSRTMIDYFEKNGGRRCRDGENPAEYMLDVIGAGDPNRKERNWAEVWNESPEYQQRQEELQHLIQERRASTRDSHEMDNSQYAMPWASQVTAVVSRTFVSYWRTPQYIIGMFMLHIFTGLFNSFTFFKLGSATIDMQSRMFSIFLTLTISPPLIQQLQPKYIGLRNLFIARENNSKIYHWSAFVIAAIVVEIPYRLVAGTLYFVSWYFPIDFPRDSFSVGYAWMLVIMFELYYLGFGQAIASMAPNDLFASLLVPIFFLFIISFCGVVVPPAALPKFWRSWMYHISPFTYLVEGLLGVLTHNVPVRCSENEFSKFTPPSNTTCQQYVGGFLQVAGGYVEQQGDECKFCRFKTGDEYAASLGVSYDHRWRAYGVFWAFVAGNFMLIFLFTWIYLYGGKRILGFVRRK